MEFRFTEDQNELRTQARRFLAAESTAAHVDKAMKTELGYDAAVWQRVATELGWPALVIPEAQDGIGLGPLDLHPLLEEMGRHVFCSPFFGTVCLGANALLVAGTAAQKQAHLPGIAAGEVTATLGYRGPDVAAHREGADAVTLRAAKTGEGYTLTGDVGYVVDGHSASLLVVAAWVDGGEGAPAELGLFVLPGETAGLTRTALPTMDQTRRLGSLRFSGVVLAEDARLSAMDGARALAVILDLAAVGLCAEQVGGAEACLDMAVEYAKVRQQFGRPIGSFQSIKHMCADMLLKVECARSVAFYASAVAAQLLSAGEITDHKARELSEAASSAKAYCSDAFFHCAGESIQIHGGIGFTWEHAAHLYFKRAQSSRTLLGSAQHHRERVASMLGQGGSMDLELTPEQEAFREQVRAWLSEHLTGRFESIKGRGGPGDEHYAVDLRMDWNRVMGAAGWNCVGWPKSAGGRGVPLMEEVIFNEEYVRAGGPGRIGHIGETLLGPTLIHFGSEAQKQKYLPGIVDGSEIWCQGYSEPNAGSDLANIQTTAELVDGQWVIHGQKVWTSLAPWADYCFVLCRTDKNAQKHKGISYLLVPMRQPGVNIVPIEQITGGSEFAEVFFDGAKTAEENVVGAVNDGWRVAMGTLAFERGASTLAQQQQFQKEFDQVLAAAQRNGALQDPVLRQRIAHAWIGLKIMRINALRTLSVDTTELGREASFAKLYWSNWHRDFGELAMEVLGSESELALPPAEHGPYELTTLQKSFLFARSDTIYAGTNQIQRNIIGERALGLPREPR